MPTHDTRALLALIPELLPRIWRDEQRYQKGGVMLADFTPANMQQGDLFAAQQQSPRSEALMQVIDKINATGDVGTAVEELLELKSQTTFFHEDLELVQVAVVFACAAFSYRFVENPLRKGAIGAFVKGVRSKEIDPPAWLKHHVVPVL